MNQLRRFDEMERMARFLSTQAEAASVPLAQSRREKPLSRSDIDALERVLKETEERMIQLNENFQILKKKSLSLNELKHVLQKSCLFFEDVEHKHEQIDDKVGLVFETEEKVYDVEALEQSTRLGYVTGVIDRERISSFENVLWRVLRGNLYMNYLKIDEPVVDPTTAKLVDKSVFIIFSHGTQVLGKIRRVCESLGANLYNVDDTEEERRKATIQVHLKIEDVRNVLFSSEQVIRKELESLSGDINTWLYQIRKEKSIYHTMNLFSVDVNRKCLVAEGWCPTVEIPRVTHVLGSGSEAAILTEIRTEIEPPTYFKTNKYTSVFQLFIDSYGVASYKEINSALFSLVTLPFFFAVMYGDVGHASLLLLGALYFIMNEKKLMAKEMPEVLDMMFKGRYVIATLGLFSMYTGLVYNDLFSRAIPIFQTVWDRPSIGDNMYKPSGRIAVFGIDTTWRMEIISNSLPFLNSFKMKMSILYGYMHMNFGLMLSLLNKVHFGDWKGIFCDVIPEFLFMFCIFGYMSILIVMKWIYRLEPSLLSTMIDMLMGMGRVGEGAEIYAHQELVQSVLWTVAVLCVLVILVAKPVLVFYERRKRSRLGYSVAGKAEEEDFKEVVIGQGIHTIETVLGSISNTASYLRLWALSLAHAQLSDVLWKMTIEDMSGNFMFLFLSTPLFVIFTFSLLVSIEGLSAFLHALRLHWVEFNGKFFKGAGYAFVPFNFE